MCIYVHMPVVVETEHKMYTSGFFSSHQIKRKLNTVKTLVKVLFWDQKRNQQRCPLQVNTCIWKIIYMYLNCGGSYGYASCIHNLSNCEIKLLYPAFTEFFNCLQKHKALARKQEQEEDVKRLQEAKDREVTTASAEEEMKNKARYLCVKFSTICSRDNKYFQSCPLSPRVFLSVVTERLSDALGEIKSWNQKILVPVWSCACVGFNKCFWTCIEKVTALSSAGSPSDFSQRSQFLVPDCSLHVWEWV